MTSETQREIEDMMSKLSGFAQHVKDTFINNSELAERVRSLEATVNDLTSQVHQVTQQNVALQETVNVLTSERDQARNRIAELDQEVANLRGQFQQRDQDANHWYAEHQQVSEQLEKIKNDRAALEEDHLRVLAENEQVKEKLKKIEEVFGPKPEPVAQPRDPETQQWRGWSDKAAS